MNYKDFETNMENLGFTVDINIEDDQLIIKDETDQVILTGALSEYMCINTMGKGYLDLDSSLQRSIMNNLVKLYKTPSKDRLSKFYIYIQGFRTSDRQPQFYSVDKDGNVFASRRSRTCDSVKQLFDIEETARILLESDLYTPIIDVTVNDFIRYCRDKDHTIEDIYEYLDKY